jgi:peptidyl-prolyl cis-trans isomerase SurA
MSAPILRLELVTLGYSVVRRFKLSVSALLFLFAVAAFLPLRISAQDVGIAAVVNDALISKADVEARLKLTLLNSNTPTDPEAQAHLEQQVLHQLIDETLETQEAKREKIDVDQNAVEAQYNDLEARNKMAPGMLDKFLAQHGVSKQQLLDQIAVRYLWGNVVRDRYGPELIVGEDEVNEKIKELQAHINEPANHIAEIFLPVSDPSQDAQVAAGAQHLVDQIKNGASFPDLARQFSQASSAAAGGDLGWVAPGTLPPDLEKIVNQMQPGTLGGPFRLTGGYYILILIDRREGGGNDDTHYSLAQVVFPLPANPTEADASAVAAKAKQMTQDLRSCDEMNALGAKISPDLSGPIGDVTLSQMPIGLRPLVEKAKVAVPFEPVPVHNGFSVFMVCGRSGGAQGIDRVAVGNAIADQKFQNASVRYLAELRRTAYIDIRE